MCFDYDEYASIYESTIRRSRKPHRCDGCRQMIPVGVLYVYASGLFDHSFFSAHYCGACELDQHLIHIHELSEGCRGQETWIAYDEIDDYFHHNAEFRELGRSDADSGQRWLERQKRTGRRGVAPESAWTEWAAEQRQATGATA